MHPPASGLEPWGEDGCLGQSEFLFDVWMINCKFTEEKNSSVPRGRFTPGFLVNWNQFHPSPQDGDNQPTLWLCHLQWSSSKIERGLTQTWFQSHFYHFSECWVDKLIRNQKRAPPDAQPYICLHYVPPCDKPTCFVVYRKRVAQFSQIEKKTTMKWLKIHHACCHHTLVFVYGQCVTSL